MAIRYGCSAHQITYYVGLGEPSQCPMCDAERVIVDMKQALRQAANKIQLLEEQSARLTEQVDFVVAMRKALDIINDEDLVFLKAVLYRWRHDRSIGLKTMHGKGKGRKLGAPNGFIATPRGAEPEGYLCTSLGGVAIAGFFGEAMRCVGSAQAMILLIRAVNQHLPGALE